MKFRFTALGLAVAILGLGLPLLSPGVTDASASGRVALPTLTSVHAEHAGNVDRVVFRFKNGLPQSFRANFVDTMHHDGSGLPVRVAGAKVLMIVFFGSNAQTKERKAFALPNVITAVSGGDFEGVVTFGLGVQKRTSFTVTQLQHPDRVVVDVAAGFPTTTRKIWLVDTNAVETGNGPYFVSRPRPIRSDAPATAALHAMFAGPTPQERAAGLRLVTSRAWGFDDLQIGAGIAGVRLTRGCNSNGSTITVAGEIAPTLRQFPTVDWVKIYGPGGATEQPSGPVDSIPTCLEP